MADEKKPARLSTWQSLAHVVTSRRTLAVTLQSFFSGMPLGLIWIAIPAWLAQVGVDIKTIGILTLAQTPWTFKFLWSPLMDHFTPPPYGRKIASFRAGVVIIILTACPRLLGVLARKHVNSPSCRAPWQNAR